MTGRDGRAYPVAGSLLTEKPSRGWRVKFNLKGHQMSFTGNSPREVHDKVATTLTSNQIEFSELDLWLNLNIQWTGRVADQRKLLVKHSDLLDLASGNAEPPVVQAKQKSTGPAVWGRKGWGMLQQYLALDTYEPGRFLLLAAELANWVNPDLNPSTGCADCYRHYVLHLDKLRRKTHYTQKEAREWLFATMNDANRRRGVPVLTYERAAKENHWI